MQRWGRIANKVGSKRKEKRWGKIANIVELNLLNADTLYSIGRDRGYYSKEDLCNAIAILLDRKPSYVRTRITQGVDFSIEQAARIGFLLEMTPKEFCDTFLNGLFIETPSGSYRVRDLYSMKPQPKPVKKRRIQANRDRLKKERDIID